jgi:hypothetical protein
MNLYSGIVKLRYGDQAHKALIGGYLGSEIDEAAIINGNYRSHSMETH